MPDTLTRPDADEEIKPDRPQELDMSPEEIAEGLEKLEKHANNPDDEEDKDTPAENEQKKLDDSVNYNPSEKKSHGNSMIKKGGIAMVPLLILIGMFIFLFYLGTLKAIHFSTTLRAVGFSSSQFIMSKAFHEAAYTTWVAQNETVELPKSKLRERIFSEDMRKVQQRLQNEGQFRYLAGEDGTTTGVQVGRSETGRLTFDDIAKSMGKETWGDLTFREKMTGRQFMGDAVKFGVSDIHQMEVRRFRNGFWKGFRQATGIKMTRFRTIFRDKFGTGSVNGDVDNDGTRLATEVEEVKGRKGGNEIVSENPDVEEAKEAVQERIEGDAKEGIRTSNAEALDGHLRTRGITRTQFLEGMGKVSAAVFATTLYCIGHDLSKASDRINEQMEFQMANYGHQQQTGMDQQEAGDMVPADASFLGGEWDGDDDTPDAAASVLYREDIGEDIPSNVDTSDVPRANITLGLLEWLQPIDKAIRTALTLGLNRAPVVGDKIDESIDQAATTGCSVVMNPYAQGAVLVVDVGVSLATLGTKDLLVQTLKGAAMFAGFATLGHIVQEYIDQVAGSGISGTEIGAPKYDAARVSTDYLNSQNSRGTTYGSPQTTAESAEIKRIATADMKEHYQNAPFNERYFALSNPYSLFGRTVAKTPTSSSGMVARLSSLGSMITQPFKMIGSVFTWTKVSAAEPKDNVAVANGFFGVNQWGWTPQEVGFMESTNLLENAAEVETAMANNPQFYTDLESCYAANKLLFQLAKDPKCSSQVLRQTAALKWRIYKLHTFALNQISSEGLYEN